MLREFALAAYPALRAAMKGGTALNLFVQDMPRLSVDIDVVFTNHMLERDAALAAISRALAESLDSRLRGNDEFSWGQR